LVNQGCIHHQAPSKDNQVLSKDHQVLSKVNQDLSKVNQELTKVNQDLSKVSQEFSKDNQDLTKVNQERINNNLLECPLVVNLTITLMDSHLNRWEHQSMLEICNRNQTSTKINEFIQTEESDFINLKSISF
jgi:septal ring factor EnvC (AmiA/AmiB activator)